MPKGSSSQAALFVGHGEDDATFLVVGGSSGTEKEVALLASRPHRTTVGQGSRDGPWRWRQLSPMWEERSCQPGLLWLGGERLRACSGGNRTAEILQLPRDDNGKGVWTLMACPLALFQNK